MNIKNIFTISFIVACACLPLRSQVLNASLYVVSQVQLDTLPYYQVIYGHLTIGNLIEGQQSDIVSLEKFSQLSYVEGDLTIARCHRLKNLHGLESLVHAGYVGNVIEKNDSLLSLEGLNNLQGLDHLVSFYIRNNPILLSLEGLSGIDSVDFLLIGNNTSLESLSGLEGIQSIRSLTLSNNALADLSGLDSLKKLENLHIGTEPQLSSLSGVPQLEQIKSNLLIRNNPMLSSLAGLDNAVADGWMTIDNNDALPSLNGLHPDDTLGYVEIWDNDLLTDISSLYPIEKVKSLSLKDNDMLLYAGFPQLKRAGSFIVQNNDALLDVDGFPVLDTIAGQELEPLKIRDNDQLKVIHFPVLRSVSGSEFPSNDGIYISNNQALEFLAMPVLETANRSVLLSGMPLIQLLELPFLRIVDDRLAIIQVGLSSLTHFNQLERGGVAISDTLGLVEINTFFNLEKGSVFSIGAKHLTSINNNIPLKICENGPGTFGSVSFILPKMASSFMLPELESIDHGFQLRNCDSLKASPLLPALIRAGNVFICDNPNLESIDGVSTLQELGDKAYLENNPKLKDCSAVCAWLDAGIEGNEIILNNNAFECLSLPAIEEYCDTVTIVAAPPSPQAQALSEIFVFPNPASAFAQVVVPPGDDWTLTLFDLTGRAHFRQIGGHQNTILLPLEAMPPGTYIIHLKSLSTGNSLMGKLAIIRNRE